MPTPWFKTRIEELEDKLHEAEAALSNALARIAELEARGPEAARAASRSETPNPGPDLDALPWISRGLRERL